MLTLLDQAFIDFTYILHNKIHARLDISSVTTSLQVMFVPTVDILNKIAAQFNGLSDMKKAALCIAIPVATYFVMNTWSYLNNQFGLNMTFEVPSKYKPISLDNDGSMNDEEKQRRQDIAANCVKVYSCKDGIPVPDDTYDVFAANLKWQDPMFYTKGLDEFSSIFTLCANMLRSDIRYVNVQHYDNAILIKFSAKWWIASNNKFASKWPEWLFVEIEKMDDNKYYATNIVDMWNGVYLLSLFGFADLFRRLQFFVMAKPGILMSPKRRKLALKNL